MKSPPIVLIHPPVTKPSEPPAGIARLAGALRSHGVACRMIDANIEGLHDIIQKVSPPTDTWSRRAFRHRQKHIDALQSRNIYALGDAYRRAVADINRLVSLSAKTPDIQLGLANYNDLCLSPVRSADLNQAAAQPERNPFYVYFRDKVLPEIAASGAEVVGISINYLSQALCAFALIGMIRKAAIGVKIVAGGGLVTSWMKRPQWRNPLSGWLDHVIAGPGEAVLLEMAGRRPQARLFLPDYDDLFKNEYLSPVPILPYSASDGCWWRRCAFCPERAEKRPFHPLPHRMVIRQIQQLADSHRPAMIHLLDNALSPALLKALASEPPGAPWYGFVRIGPPLDDPDFCRQLAAAGCAMMKIGLESGDQGVLDALDKGIRLETASTVLRNLKQAGIATYVYLLFGTPAENEDAARKTLAFTARHHDCIDFVNLAIFNLPLGGPEAGDLRLRAFYPGDLALYSDFEHPQGWHRGKARQFVDKQFKKHPAIQSIIRRDPPIFTSNHAPFFVRGSTI